MANNQDATAPKPKAAPTEITMSAADLGNARGSDYGRLAELKYEGVKGLMGKIFDHIKHVFDFLASPPLIPDKVAFKNFFYFLFSFPSKTTKKRT